MRRVKDKHAYAAQIVKEKLGIRDEDLILNGAPISEVVSFRMECTGSASAGSYEKGKFKKNTSKKNRFRKKTKENKEKEKRERHTDVVMGAIILTEFCRVKNGQKSRVACFDENDRLSVRPTFYSALKSLNEKYSIEDLRNLFPGVRDEYIAFISILTEKYSKEHIAKLFPGIDQDYVNFLAESQLGERTMAPEFEVGDIVSLSYDSIVHGTVVKIRQVGEEWIYLVDWGGDRSWESGRKLEIVTDGDEW